MPDDLVTKTTLHAETVLNHLPKDNIHEGQISLTHGFIPYQAIPRKLPLGFESWDKLQQGLAQLLATGREREAMDQLELIDASNPETLPNEYLARAASVLGNLAHAYYFNKKLGSTQTTDPLPNAVRIPWEQVNTRIGRRFESEEAELQAFRSCYDVFLNNFKLINPHLVIDGGDTNLNIQGSDLDLINYATGLEAERGNNLTFILAELRFAAALSPMLKALKAVASENDDALIEACKRITHVLEKTIEVLDHLTPNQYSTHYVDQVNWTRSVATFDGRIPGGHLGLSGSEFPMFQTMDIFFERPSYDTPFGKAFAKKQGIQPLNTFNFHKGLHEDITTYSLQAYADKCENPLIKMHYQAMFDTYLQLMSFHRSKAFGYMQINFLSGRPITNGGNSGEENIYQELRLADEERACNYRHLPHYATKIFMVSLGTNAKQIVLNTADTGFTFAPGDRCMILPENNTESIAHFVEQHQLDRDALILLNERWQCYFKDEIGINASQLVLSNFLKYVALDEINDTDLKQGVQSDLLYPIRPRQYSQSPINNRTIRLTVGQHLYPYGETQRAGLASDYLIQQPIESALRIKKVAARNFHLPENSETPIVLIAAGTGIGPMMGFIDERKKTSAADKNWLFYSVRDQETFYHGDELLQAARDGKLNLHVAFTRNKDTTQKTQRINDLIDEHAAGIARLITEEGAHVFVCGSIGFADTVRQAISTAIANHTPEATARYLDTMVADHRYKIDVFSQHQDDENQAWYRSEIARHNKYTDCWTIIQQRDQAGRVTALNVYDLNKSNFMSSHPGGQKILQVNAGLDGTTGYRVIGHHRDQQIEALLKGCKIGVVANPVFADSTEELIYQITITCIERLTQMQNNLSITTKLFLANPPAYLWRNNLFGFYGKESEGPFQEMLRGYNELNELVQNPSALQNLEEYYLQLNQLAGFIFENTQTSDSEKAQQLQAAYDTIMIHNKLFFKEMKAVLGTMAYELETQSLQDGTVCTSLERMNRLIHSHIDNTNALSSILGITSTTVFHHPKIKDGSVSGCPMMKSKKRCDHPENAVSPPLQINTTPKAPQRTWCGFFAQTLPIAMAVGATTAIISTQLGFSD